MVLDDQSERCLSASTIAGTAAGRALAARLIERLECLDQPGGSCPRRGIRIAEAQHLEDRIGHVAPHQEDRTAALIHKRHLN